MSLFVSDAPTARFEEIGDKVEGEIVDIYQSQRYQYVQDGVGGPLFWVNRRPTEVWSSADARGLDPVMQTVLVIDTGVADEKTGDTERRFFVKYHQEDAVSKAVNISGAKRKGMRIGGRFSATFTGWGKAKGGARPPALMEYVYTQPEDGEGTIPDLKATARYSPVYNAAQGGEVLVGTTQAVADGETTQDFSGISAPKTDRGPQYSPGDDTFKGESALNRAAENAEESRSRSDEPIPF